MPAHILKEKRLHNKLVKVFLKYFILESESCKSLSVSNLCHLFFSHIILASGLSSILVNKHFLKEVQLLPLEFSSKPLTLTENSDGHSQAISMSIGYLVSLNI